MIIRDSTYTPLLYLIIFQFYINVKNTVHKSILESNVSEASTRVLLINSKLCEKYLSKQRVSFIICYRRQYKRVSVSKRSVQMRITAASGRYRVDQSFSDKIELCDFDFTQSFSF